MIPSYSLAQVFGISISEQRKIYFNHRNTLISLLSNTLIVANTFCDFKTLTADNGSEFSMHKQITEITGANVFFARPYHSWERGLNEHSNGLIRRFYPKGTDFNSVTDNEIAELEHILNTRGRKSLGYFSPNEVFLAHLMAA
ncbi:IS30 family transposase [Arsenophonus sp. ENCA]|uniref:IS30 family transposase n=1 Tax=Arsenophonus sp. ENCA TaxID=1987579 RepID=UPI0025BEF572|nr:IS30 family transposase [Arsenophonus sp. ENCA]